MIVGMKLTLKTSLGRIISTSWLILQPLQGIPSGGRRTTLFRAAHGHQQNIVRNVPFG